CQWKVYPMAGGNDIHRWKNIGLKEIALLFPDVGRNQLNRETEGARGRWLQPLSFRRTKKS
ncbi:MAG: hypothetical protein J6M57_07835, partial [Acidaminococcaceae bacterium]|nr:hypothetical protein [Acidaminococcaceae bacterium]